MVGQIVLGVEEREKKLKKEKERDREGIKLFIILYFPLTCSPFV